MTRQKIIRHCLILFKDFFVVPKRNLFSWLTIYRPSARKVSIPSDVNTYKSSYARVIYIASWGVDGLKLYAFEYIRGGFARCKSFSTEISFFCHLTNTNRPSENIIWNVRRRPFRFVQTRAGLLQTNQFSPQNELGLIQRIMYRYVSNSKRVGFPFHSIYHYIS